MKSTNGFTLLEILISVGVLAIVSTLIAQVLFTTTRVNKKAEILREVKGNGEFAIDVFSRLARNAVAVETVCDIGADSTPAAVFRNADNRRTTIRCWSDGTAARIASVSADTVYISGANLTLSASGGSSCADSSLSFSCPVESGVVTPMVIQFSLGTLAEAENEQVRSSFQTAVTVRN